MANTTNFNWATPDDTDLVKDGAAAIRTLGSSIDTSFVDLKGGTTGQVLSKATNTDLDYTWITPNVGDITEVQAGTGISVASGTGPIPVVTNTVATTFDAKGDLVAGTGADTFAKLTVGANDTVLTADSSTATGLKWATPAAGGGMTLINTGGTTLTGASVTISSIPGTYNALEGFIRVYRPATDGSAFNMRFNGVGTANTYFNAEGAQLEGTIDAFNASTTVLSYGLDNGTQYSLIHFYIPDYANSSSWKFVEVASIAADATTPTSVTKLWAFGIHNQTTAITSLEFLSSSGNMTSGTLFLYGVK